MTCGCHLPSGLSAYRIYDQVHTEVGPRRSRVLAAAVDGLRAQAVGALAPGVLGLDHADVIDLTQQRRLQVTRPIVPAPITSAECTSWPASPKRTACTPLASGSVRAPTRMSRSSGSGRRLAAGALTRSANAPGAVDADQCALRAQVLLPGAAHRAVPASGDRVNGHAHADPVLCARTGGQRPRRRTRGP